MNEETTPERVEVTDNESRVVRISWDIQQTTQVERVLAYEIGINKFIGIKKIIYKGPGYIDKPENRRFVYISKLKFLKYWNGEPKEYTFYVRRIGLNGIPGPWSKGVKTKQEKKPSESPSKTDETTSTEPERKEEIKKAGKEAEKEEKKIEKTEEALLKHLKEGISKWVKADKDLIDDKRDTLIIWHKKHSEKRLKKIKKAMKNIEEFFDLEKLKKQYPKFYLEYEDSVYVIDATLDFWKGKHQKRKLGKENMKNTPFENITHKKLIKKLISVEKGIEWLIKTHNITKKEVKQKINARKRKEEAEKFVKGFPVRGATEGVQEKDKESKLEKDFDEINARGKVRF